MHTRTALAFLLTLLITSALQAQTAADTAVLALFEKRCAECHKGDEEPDLHAGMSLRTLRDEPKYVVPGKADSSELFTRCTLPPDTKKRMPKSKGAPGEEDYRAPLTTEELQILRTWIEGDATSRTTARPFITDDAINNAILADLEKLTPRDSIPLVRYLTLTNLANTTDASGSARFTDTELDLYRGAVDKLLNSLSWRSDIVRAVPIDSEKTILRIYLPSYGWKAEFWERIISFYPYAILSGSKPERDAAALTNTALPRVRADWFIFALAQPPLYHEALELPGADGKEGADAALEKQLGVALTRNLQGGRALRSGFEKSGVSQGNRMIERHPQRDRGAYWKSYDFDPKRKDQLGGDLFAAPLGPVGLGLTTDSSHEFQHDGGEIIFNLPNGLQAYLLTDAKGKRLNTAPPNIVHDDSRPDGIIINGVSCMSCHHSGMFTPPADEVARVASAALRGDDATLVRALYQQPAIAKAIDEDSAKFIAAMAKCGAAPAKTAKDEPIRALYDRFRADITQHQLASEFGQSSEHFLTDMKRSKEERVRLLAAKLEQNVTIPRQSFLANFELIAETLALGNLRSFQAPPFVEFAVEPAKKAIATPKHIVLIAGEEEYRSEEFLPALASILQTEHGFKCSMIYSVDQSGFIDPNNPALTSSIQPLETADMIVMMIRFRQWSDETMGAFDKAIKRGIPIVGLRTSNHAFKFIPTDRWAEYNTWSKDVFGTGWVSHWGKHKTEATRGVVDLSTPNKSLINGVRDWFGDTDVYESTVPPDAAVIAHGLVLTGMTPDSPLSGRVVKTEGGERPVNAPPMPVAWSRSLNLGGAKNARVFYTSCGGPTDFLDESFRRLLVNAIYWGFELPVPQKASVTLPSSYKAVPYGYGTFIKGKRP